MSGSPTSSQSAPEIPERVSNSAEAIPIERSMVFLLFGYSMPYLNCLFPFISFLGFCCMKTGRAFWPLPPAV